MPEKNVLWFRWPAWIVTIIFWLACIYMTHSPRPPDFTNIVHNDKIKHFCGYGTLASMIYFSLWIKGINKRLLVILILIMLAVYGALDERTQPWFGRDCDIHDWYADMCGTAAAMIFWTALRSMVKQMPA